MATELLAIGNTAASSDAFELAAAESTLLIFRPGPDYMGHQQIALEVEDSDGTWQPVGALSTSATPRLLDGPGNYRVTRPAGTSAGVDQG